MRRSPFALGLREEALEEDVFVYQPGSNARAEVIQVQLAKLPSLRQVLQLSGLVGKHARAWEATQAGGFFEAALGSWQSPRRRCD